jgi:hypothetical protein
MAIRAATARLSTATNRVAGERVVGERFASERVTREKVATEKVTAAIAKVFRAENFCGWRETKTLANRLTLFRQSQVSP